MSTKVGNFQRPDDVVSTLKQLARNGSKHSDLLTSWDPEEKPGPVPGVTLSFKIREKAEYLQYKALVRWDALAPGTCQADIDFYTIEVRPLTKIDSGGDYQTSDGQRWKIQDDDHPLRDYYFVNDLEDLEPNKLKVKFNYLDRPKSWYRQTRVRVTDKAGRRGEWSAWTYPELPWASGDDAAMPKPPTPTGIALDFYRDDDAESKRDYAVNVVFDEVGKWDIPPSDNPKDGIQDSEDDVKAYHVQLAHVDPNILDNPTTGAYRKLHPVRNKTVPSKKQERDDDKLVDVDFQGLMRKRYYQARVRTRDRYGRFGEWSSWTFPSTPADVRKPPEILSLRFKIKEKGFVVDFDLPEDPKDTDDDSNLKERHPDIAYAQVNIATRNFNDPAFKDTDIIVKDRYLAGTHKQYDYDKIGGTYWCRVRTADYSGNRSDWVIKSADSQVPPQPVFSGVGQNATISLGFDQKEKSKGHKYRGLVRVFYNENVHTEAHMHEYRVQIQVHQGKEANFKQSDEKYGQDIPWNDEDRLAVFRKLQAKDWFRARFAVVDRQGRRSPYSVWSDPIRVTEGGKTNPPQNVRTIKGVRRIGIKFEPSKRDFDVIGNNGLPVPDPQVTHYWAQLSLDRSFTTIVDEAKQVINNKVFFDIPDSHEPGEDAAFRVAGDATPTRYFARVAGVDEEGNISEWVYNTTTQEPPSASDQGDTMQMVRTKDLWKDAVTFDKLAVDAIRAKHKIVGPLIMTDDPPNARIVLKDVAGENDKLKFYGTPTSGQSNLVGYLQARQGDIFGSGDFALQGLMVSNSYQGAPPDSMRGWGRLHIESGDLVVRVRRADGTVDVFRLEKQGAGNFLTKSEAASLYAPLGHNHDGRYFTQDEVRDRLGNKSNKGHTHDVMGQTAPRSGGDGHDHNAGTLRTGGDT